MAIYITGIGMLTALGRGCTQTADALRQNRIGLAPLTLFSHTPALPVGEIKVPLADPHLPRTHQIARMAAQDAIQDCGGKTPDAVILGVTTGGMPRTELMRKSQNPDPESYRYHAAGSVAECIAESCGCQGPVFTVSTACSSGAVAAALGMRLLQSGLAGSVLAGGADALCRLTYHGFNALQLLSATGARPFDRERDGMSLSEGAAMLYLESAQHPPENARAQLMGFGLSCDAYHAAAPHPEGRGAKEAMAAAMRSAGLEAAEIDYINLHGTGTVSNDAAEARAVSALFGSKHPRVSSIKGAAGHSLAAAGAVELAVSVTAIRQGLIPGNAGMQIPDPDLHIAPSASTEKRQVKTVLSNSFGFGGNNAALAVARPGGKSPEICWHPAPMAVVGNACVTGAGKTDATTEAFLSGTPCGGILGGSEISSDLPSKAVRRLKRLPRIVLCLARAALDAAGRSDPSAGVFFGTGWGALTETDDFLTRLFANQERFSSPMDFVGSVHNAPAGEVAMMFGATGPNVTMTGGDYSFEQALIAASLLAEDEEAPFLVIGADEHHDELTPLFDPSAAGRDVPADGGGALCLRRAETGLLVRPVFYGPADCKGRAIDSLIAQLGGAEAIRRRFGVLFAGIPAGDREAGKDQVQMLQNRTDLSAPIIDYRKYTGEFASASAAGVSMAAACVGQNRIPPLAGQNTPRRFSPGAALVLGTGRYLTAIEVFCE